MVNNITQPDIHGLKEDSVCSDAWWYYQLAGEYRKKLNGWVQSYMDIMPLVQKGVVLMIPTVYNANHWGILSSQERSNIRRLLEDGGDGDANIPT